MRHVGFALEIVTVCVVVWAASTLVLGGAALARRLRELVRGK
jgi:hypothetical protein